MALAATLLLAPRVRRHQSPHLARGLSTKRRRQRQRTRRRARRRRRLYLTAPDALIPAADRASWTPGHRRRPQERWCAANRMRLAGLPQGRPPPLPPPSPPPIAPATHPQLVRPKRRACAARAMFDVCVPWSALSVPHAFWWDESHHLIALTQRGLRKLWSIEPNARTPPFARGAFHHAGDRAVAIMCNAPRCG